MKWRDIVEQTKNACRLLGGRFDEEYNRVSCTLEAKAAERRLKLTIEPSARSPGNFDLTIKVEDEHGQAASLAVTGAPMKSIHPPIPEVAWEDLEIRPTDDVLVIIDKDETRVFLQVFKEKP